MQRTKWTAAQKAEALLLVAEVGQSEAARRTDIPFGTVASWAKRAGVEAPYVAERAKAVETMQVVWAERRVAFGERLSQIAERAAERVAERIEDDRTPGLRDLTVSMAVLVDKAQLLTGGSTARTENVHLEGKGQLLDEAAERARHLRAV